MNPTTPPATARYAPTKAIVICLKALSIGPLTREGCRWRFGRRLFGARAVNELIGLGLAKRDGEFVRGTT
jgi:hypothetical protein